jgi:hypothetical protein
MDDVCAIPRVAGQAKLSNENKEDEIPTLVDNCSAHANETDFLPPNTTSCLKQCDSSPM